MINVYDLQFCTMNGNDFNVSLVSKEKIIRQMASENVSYTC